MSLASQAGTVIATLAAASAAASLWSGSLQYAGPVRRACRWFAFAAVLWGAGVILGRALPVPVGASAIPLSFADLPGLLALLAMAAGLARLAAASQAAGGQPLAQDAWRGAGEPVAWAADGYVFASSLFLIGWVALFGSVFGRAGTGPATFAAELIHPLADLVVLGATLPLAGLAGRRGVAPYLAILAMTVSDSLAVGARISGAHAGTSALLVQVAAFALLAVTPWEDRARAGAAGRWSGLAAVPRHAGEDATAGGAMDGVLPAAVHPASARAWLARDPEAADRPGRAGQRITATAAAAAAVTAAVVIVSWVLAGGHQPEPVVPFVAGVTILTLAFRVLSLIRREYSASRAWHDSGRQFRQLADRTSDVVLLCDLDGVIRFASRAVSGYGYAPEDLRGRRLADVLHPEDRSGGARAVRRAVTDPAQRVGRYSCRVRAADGTWRHIESALSRYQHPGSPDQLLVTARDVSAQVALGRQVTHLTFHDGLTGLPNRAYVEQRARGVLDPAHGDDGAPAGAVAGAIFVDLDGFTAVNDAAGHNAGDLLLAQVARRLRAAVPPQDTVARWGGDQFAVLVEGAVSAEEIIDIAERLARGVALPPFRAGDEEVALTASVGVAFWHGGTVGYLWRNAEMAMARAKESGGDRVEVFAHGVGDGGSGGPGGAAGVRVPSGGGPSGPAASATASGAGTAGTGVPGAGVSGGSGAAASGVAAAAG